MTEFKGRLMHGEHHDWWPNGNLRLEGRFLNDHRDGPWRHLSDHGVVVAEGSYLNKKKNGAWITREEYGPISSIGSYKEGRRHGEWQFYMNGVLLFPESRWYE